MAVDTFDAVIDSWIDVVSQDDNMGSDVSLILGYVYAGGGKAVGGRPIVNFDVSALAGEVINSAKLVYYVANNFSNSDASRLSRCTRPATWTEGGVTWKKYDGTNDWTTKGGDFDDTGPPAAVNFNTPAGGGWREITGLKAFVEDALDNRSGIVSLILRHLDVNPGVTNYLTIRSREHASGDVCYLDVTYGLPAARRSLARSPLASGAPPARPAGAARPAPGVRPARPYQPRGTR